jgi:hypothetical protein
MIAVFLGRKVEVLSAVYSSRAVENPVSLVHFSSSDESERC